MKYQFKDPSAKIVFKDGRELSPANITDEVVEELIAGNVNYKDLFDEVQSIKDVKVSKAKLD